MKYHRSVNWFLIAVLLLFVTIAAVGDSNFTNVVTSGDITVGDDLTVTGDTNLAGDTTLDTVTLADVVTQAANIENVGVPSVIQVTVPYTEATYPIATVVTGEIWIVTDVVVHVTEDFDCTGDDCTLLVGDASDNDGFIVLADAQLQAADTEYTGAIAGWQGLAAATRGVYLDEVTTNSYHPQMYGGAAAATINAYVIETTGATGSAGSADVYVFYTRLE